MNEFDIFLSEDIIDFYNKIKNNELDELELLILKNELKKLIKQTQRDNLYGQLVLLFNTVMYNFNKTFNPTGVEVNDILEISKKMIKLERKTLKKLQKNINEKKEDYEFISNVYLLLNALIFIQIEIMNCCSDKLKEDEYMSKGIYYMSNRRTNIEECQNKMQLASEHVKKLK